MNDFTKIVNELALSNISSTTAIVTLSEAYSALICICYPNFGVYTSPQFESSNLSCHKVHIMGDTYFANQASFSVNASIDGISIISTNTAMAGKAGVVVNFITGCKTNDVISLNPNPIYGGKFNGKVTIIGIK